MDSTLSNTSPSPHHLTKFDVRWFGPSTEQWEWIKANIAHGPAVSSLADWNPSNLAGGPEPSPDNSPWVANRQGMDPGNFKVLAAMEGRFDPRLQQFLGWQADWSSRPATIPAMTLPTATISPEASPPKRGRRTKKASLPHASEANRLNDGGFSDQFGLILSDFWPGHRRTFPLPDWCVPFYWYELFDRIIPWINRQPSPPSGDEFPSKPGRVSARVEQLLDSASKENQLPGSETDLSGMSVLIVCDTLTSAGEWDELFQTHKVRPVSCHPSATPLRMRPEVVIVDLGSRARHHFRESWVDARLNATIQQLRRRFPTSLLVVADSFPRWVAWSSYLSNGADILIPRPFQWFGLLWCLKHWLNRPQQGRI